MPAVLAVSASRDLPIVEGLLQSLAAGDPVSFETLDSAQATLMETFGPAGTPLPEEGLEDDPVISAAVDIQNAMALMEPSDGALSWNAGGLAADAGHHLEAAFLYIDAARRIEADISAGTPDLPDDEDWAESALYHAAKNFILGGQPVSAAIVRRRMKDDSSCMEIDELLKSRAGRDS